VKGYKDKYGNEGSEVKATVTLVRDTDAPKFVSATAKDDTITVKFDEKIAIEDTLVNVGIKFRDKDNVVITKSDAGVTATVVDKRGDAAAEGDVYLALAVTEGDFLADEKLIAGTYEVTIPAGVIKDLAENKTKAIKFTVVVTGEVDTKAIVEVKSAEQVTNKPGSITVQFTVDGTNAVEMGQSALDYKNYKIAGKAIPKDSKIYFDGDKTTVRIDLPEGFIKVTGERELVVTNVKDIDGNTLKEGKNKTAIAGLLENVRPYATKVEFKSSQTIVVTFSEAIKGSDFEGITVKIGTVKVELADTGGFKLEGKELTITAKKADAFKQTDKISVEFESCKLADDAGNTVKDGTVKTK